MRLQVFEEAGGLSPAPVVPLPAASCLHVLATERTTTRSGQVFQGAFPTLLGRTGPGGPAAPYAALTSMCAPDYRALLQEWAPLGP